MTTEQLLRYLSPDEIARARYLTREYRTLVAELDLMPVTMRRIHARLLEIEPQLDPLVERIRRAEAAS